MEFFAQHLLLWTAFLAPALAYLGLSHSLLARRNGRGLPLAGLAAAVAIVAGVLAGFGLVHIGCGWLVDKVVSTPMTIGPNFGF